MRDFIPKTPIYKDKTPDSSHSIKRFAIQRTCILILIQSYVALFSRLPYLEVLSANIGLDT